MTDRKRAATGTDAALKAAAYTFPPRPTMELFSTIPTPSECPSALGPRWKTKTAFGASSLRRTKVAPWWVLNANQNVPGDEDGEAAARHVARCVSRRRAGARSAHS